MPDLRTLWPILTAFVTLVAGGIGLPPIPEEIPTVVAGIWVASSPEIGPIRWIILPVCYAGVLISDLLLYGIGRLWGRKLLKQRWMARVLPEEMRVRIEHNFHRYGIKILLMIRWVPGIRSPMFITAGLMKLPLVRFLIADSIAAVFGHTLLFFLAYWFGDHFKDLLERAEADFGKTIRAIVVLTIIALVGVYFLIRFWRRPVMTGDPHEVPLIGDQVAARMDSQAPPEPAPPTEPVEPKTTEPVEQRPTT